MTLMRMEIQYYTIFTKDSLKMVNPLNDHISVAKCKAMYHDDDFVSDVLKACSPFLYAFIIEFSLVGGTVFFNTWNNVNNVQT